MTAIADLKIAHRATWAAGDYAAIAELIDEAPPRDLLARVEVTPGQEVLDVATGTGNIAIPAAAAGAQVVGLDLTPELFGTARRRAEEHGVVVDWVEGDAEDLPFEDERFDRVLSAFGVQFAPRHEIVAHELARVCRPGGRIGLVNWTPEGQVGELFKIMGRYLPAPPDYASPPPLWGSEDHVRGLSPTPRSSSSSPAASTRGGSNPPSTTSSSWRRTTGRPSRPASASPPRRAGSSAAARSWRWSSAGTRRPTAAWRCTRSTSSRWDGRPLSRGAQ
jgi:SAM-dependent methyltransferase